jgi:hypothetical protein
VNRNERVEVRANVAEVKQIDQVAKRLEMTRSEAIRHLVNQEAKRIK